MSERPLFDASGLEAFRREVVADERLVARLRPILDRDAFIRAASELGAQRGYRFAPGEVAAAMREGQLAWLTHWLPVVGKT